MRRTEPHVACNNQIAEKTTVVEVHAADEPGLAYRIASALTAFGLDIVCAKIATEKSDALDVFYVTNFNEMKLSDHEMRLLEAELTRLLMAGSGEATTTARP